MLLGALGVAATIESRVAVAPQTAPEMKGSHKHGDSKDGKATATGPVNKPRNDSLNKNVGRKTKKTEGEGSRKRGCDKAPGREWTRSKGDKTGVINQTPPLDISSGTQPDQNLQTLFMSFKNLTQRQFKNLRDEGALEVYRKFKDDEARRPQQHDVCLQTTREAN